MKNSLKEIFQIQEVLKDSGYLDISRISKEIADFSENNNIPLEKILERIRNHEPWEYIKGDTEFCGFKFLVNKNTLIPRIETEQIIDIANNFLADNPYYSNVVDVGTGSGCIIISLIKNLSSKNRYKFFATDINDNTLDVAKQNTMLHKVYDKVSLTRTNLVKDLDLQGDTLIIANLPYVPTSMYNKLEASVKNFEPQIAIDGGKDGFKYYKELLEQVKKIKKEKEKYTLLIEIEPTTLPNIKAIIGKDFNIIKDYRDLDRFLLIHLP